MVLRDLPRRRPAPDDSRHLPEPERRRPDAMGVPARHEPAGARRGKLSAGERAFHRAGIAAEQVQRPLGHGSCRATVPRSHPATRAASSRTESVVGPLGLGGLSATTSPETSGYLRTTVQNRQVTWQSPVTNRLLLEAGLGSYVAAWGPFEAPGNLTRGLVRVTELQARNGAVANFNYRSANWAENWDNPNRWRASASYVTGAHSMKFGYEGSYLVEDIENHGNDLNLAYQFNGGRPSQLTESLRVFKQKDRVRTAALYVQDQWTRGRMTLQGALRFDNARSYSPEQTIGPALINGQTFLATPLAFPRTDGVNFKDVSPRGGLALDVFGNGKTALKVNFGKYMDPASNLNGNYSISNPIARIATTASRTWTDNGTGGVPGTPARGLHSSVRSHQQRGQRRMRRDDPDDVRYVGADDRGDRPEPSQRLGRSSAGLADRRVGAAASAAARLRGDWLLEAVAPELHGHRQPRGRSPATSHRSASPRRSTRGCPTVAVTRSARSTTWSLRVSVAPATTSPGRTTSATSIRASTACWSASARESATA